MDNNHGFSLVELVVVITIIAILTLVGAVSYRNTVRESRDQKRIVNLQKVRSDLELFRSSNDASVYPLTLTELTTQIPLDPQSESNEYSYTPYSYDGITTCDNTTIYCATYVLSTPLEYMGDSYVVRPNSEDLVTDSANVDGTPTARISKNGGSPSQPAFSAVWGDNRPSRKLWIGKCDDANCRKITTAITQCPRDEIHLKNWSAEGIFCKYEVTTQSQGISTTPYNFELSRLTTGTYAVGVNQEVQVGSNTIRCTGNPTFTINGCVDNSSQGIVCNTSPDWISCNPAGSEDYVIITIP